METQIIREDLAIAAEIIRRGGLVGVPTETVYGLAGNGLDEQAVRQIYEVKGRPEVKPLALMVPDAGEIESYCLEVPEAARALAEKFWPGPLSIVLKAKTDIVPDIVRAGGETVSLRCPDHPMTLKALRLTGLPFAAPSANPSGSPSPKTAGEVLDYFSGKIDAVIDGGPCGIGRESTILDMSRTPYRILRQGALPAEEIEAALRDSLKLIGITGPSGSGKTSALGVLEREGALVLDCDAVYHELLAQDRELLDALRARWPDAFEGEALDRRKLAQIVFSDPEALKQLNEITHRFISREITRRLTEFALNGGRIAALDAIELISSGLGALCDCVIGVLAEPETRLSRIVSRDGISREAALLRIQAQKDDQYFIDSCDRVVYNNGSAAEFEQTFMNMLEEIRNG